jgi:hypothetical protein
MIILFTSWSGAFSRYPLYLFLAKSQKKDVASIGAKKNATQLLH